MKQFGLIFLFFFSLINSQVKEIAISFDDSPRFARGYFTGEERAKRLIDALKKHKVEQVAFFSNSNKLNAEGLKRMTYYDSSNHIIANHSHSHPNINTTSLADFRQEILKADSILQHFKNYRKLFRFPFLREGNSLEKRDGIRKLFKEHGFKNAYITLNNYDWYIESLFQKAIKSGKKVDLKRLEKFYVNVLMQSITYYDEMAIRYLGRSPKHVLLLHEMDISALFIGALVDELRNKGWRIISVEEAYTDEIANYETKELFPFNPGRIGEIARDKGQKKGLWHNSLDESYLEERFKKEVLKD